ncbi:aspartate-semialdehyde dehydrogenase [Buchnera aphidicola]|uniref:aspartate-semialdehyde dehydrogenase n=1 Tax=Buchnera aphidicola TaxID=9 RepID=UPI0034638675
MKNTVGFIGWRGIVGSVLLQRMIEERNFSKINAVFFSTSQIGTVCPNISDVCTHNLRDAYNLKELQKMDIIVSCQGTEYTNTVYYKLRNTGWLGYWIDASSSLRMNDDAIIVLDPINYKYIEQSIQNGTKTFVGGNCTVSLMLMALGGLFCNNMVEYITFSTYQAASGAGSKHMIELLQQMGYLYNSVYHDLKNSKISILDIEKRISNISKNSEFPKQQFLAPLAGNILPWIDSLMPNMQTKEEWKVQSEANKILNCNSIIPMDGTCVRVSTFRCHSQSFIIKLKKHLSYFNIVDCIQQHNSWVNIIPNDFDSTINLLTPNAITGTLNIAVGRIRKLLSIGQKFLSVFTVGDQLLWGAAEPIRRMLMILNKK